MIKAWKDLTIGDKVCFFIITESALYKIYSDYIKKDLDTIVGNISYDTVTDRYDRYKIELKEHGLMEFSESDLEYNSDSASCGSDDFMFLATSQEGILNELRKMFSRFDIKKI